MKPVFRANLYFLIIILLEIILPEFLAPLLLALVKDRGITLVLVHAIVFLLPAAIYLIVTKSNVKRTLRLNKISLKEFFYAILVAILAQPVVTLFSLISAFFFDNDVAKMMEGMQNTPYWMMLLIVAVTPAITEEITVRGIILSGYNNKNKFTAAIMTGVIFGIFHLNAQQFLYAVVLGMVFAYMVRVTNSIFVSMICHFTVNGIQVSLQKIVTSFIKINKPEDYSLRALPIGQKLEMLVVYGFVALIFAALMYIVIRAMENKAKSRGVIDSALAVREEDFYVDGYSNGSIELRNERVINVPFIITLVVYIIYMAIILILG